MNRYDKKKHLKLREIFMGIYVVTSLEDDAIPYTVVGVSETIVHAFTYIKGIRHDASFYHKNCFKPNKTQLKNAAN